MCCLENPRDGGAWWAAIYGVAQSRTRLKWLSSSNQASNWGPLHWEHRVLTTEAPGKSSYFLNVATRKFSQVTCIIFLLVNAALEADLAIAEPWSSNFTMSLKTWFLSSLIFHSIDFNLELCCSQQLLEGHASLFKSRKSVYQHSLPDRLGLTHRTVLVHMLTPESILWTGREIPWVVHMAYSYSWWEGQPLQYHIIIRTEIKSVGKGKEWNNWWGRNQEVSPLRMKDK